MPARALRYLRTDESCDTCGRSGGRSRAGVRRLPRALRLGGRALPDVPRRRRRRHHPERGQRAVRRCARASCPPPRLRGIVPPGQLPEARPRPRGPWVQMLQRLLDVERSPASTTAHGRAGPAVPGDQLDPAGDGKVGERTWGALREQRCGHFDLTGQNRWSIDASGSSRSSSSAGGPDRGVDRDLEVGVVASVGLGGGGPVVQPGEQVVAGQAAQVAAARTGRPRPARRPGRAPPARGGTGRSRPSQVQVEPSSPP